MRRITLLAILGLTGSACDGPDRDAAPALPPVALIAPVDESMDIMDRLGRMESELVAAAHALQNGDGGEAAVRILRAGAIGDRLLEVEPPTQWVAPGYLAEARVRQLQSRADRVVALLRRGPTRRALAIELRGLIDETRAVRSALEQPAGEPPPPLEALLSGQNDHDDGDAPHD